MAKQFICKDCMSTSETVIVTKGAFITETFFWILAFILSPFTYLFSFILPIFYTLWRLTSKYKACSACKSKNLIPINSAAGLRLLNIIRSTSLSVKEKKEFETVNSSLG